MIGESKQTVAYLLKVNIHCCKNVPPPKLSDYVLCTDSPAVDNVFRSVTKEKTPMQGCSYLGVDIDVSLVIYCPSISG